MDGQQRFLALVMAGGKGSRLFPLTLDRAKPAVPFGGRYRIIDFVLSNLANSGIRVGLRADPVQVAVAGRARAAHLGIAQRARQLRHRRARADAHGRVLVPRHRRLGVPEPPPDRGVPRRRRARLRRRPHLQDEHPADDRLPLPEGGDRDRRVPADQEGGGAAVRHRRGRRGLAHHRLPGEARARSGHDPGRSRRTASGSMGNYVFAPGPLVEELRADSERAVAPRLRPQHPARRC